MLYKQQLTSFVYRFDDQLQSKLKISKVTQNLKKNKHTFQENVGHWAME